MWIFGGIVFLVDKMGVVNILKWKYVWVFEDICEIYRVVVERCEGNKR